MPGHSIGPNQIKYSVRRNDRAKRIRVAVSVEGIIVTAPNSVSQERVQAFVTQNVDWITRKVGEMENSLQKVVKPVGFVSGEKILFQGDVFTLRVSEYLGKQTKISLEGEEFIIRVSSNLPEKDRPKEVRSQLERFYRQLARQAVTERLEYFSGLLRVKFADVRIKEQKTRWGSCSRRGNLNFNWKIVMAPSDIIDYIVVHELCHLVHMNHSQRFWGLVETILPDYQDRKRWLTQNHLILNF